MPAGLRAVTPVVVLTSTELGPDGARRRRELLVDEARLLDLLTAPAVELLEAGALAWSAWVDLPVRR